MRPQLEQLETRDAPAALLPPSVIPPTTLGPRGITAHVALPQVPVQTQFVIDLAIAVALFGIDGRPGLLGGSR